MAIQTTTNTYQTRLNKAFYDRKLLETAKNRLVHASFGQKRSIPKHNGKRVEFRRYELFTPNQSDLTLVEGVTPDGQSLAQSGIEATVKQYGAYVEVSDLLDMTAYDEVIADSAELLGEQLGTVIEWVTRDAMASTTNVQYVNGKTARNQLEPTDKLTVDDIRKAVRTLKKNKARMFTTTADGSVRKPHFICICSPEATYDLQSDPLWQDVSKYSNAEQIYSGEIGRLFGVVFVESTEAKVYSQSVYTTVAAFSEDHKTVTLNGPFSDSFKQFFAYPGAKVWINQTDFFTNDAAKYDGNTATIRLNGAFDGGVGTKVYSDDAGVMDGTTKIASPVHATLVFGADAYGVIDVDGSGTMETIIKPHGSSGSSDPLNQRATVGAKVAAYTAIVLNPLWLVKIEHGVSA